MLSRLFATGLWLAVTVASTAMVWMATSIVAADVTDRPAPVVAHRDVVSELASVTGPTTTTTVPSETPPTTVPPSRGPVATRPNPAVPVVPTSPTTVPAVTIAPLPPPAVAPPPATPPTTQSPPLPTATYATSGGVVRVACNGVVIELIYAIPGDGYSVKVLASGPGNVDVVFSRPGQRVPVKVVCFGEPIRYDQWEE
ncbi:MAG TPA: hypothetical protein VM942_02280 [Acidimicrobiales bacterium]|nr:hypothetical protein [Acidimicrobiales bacterium]